MARNRIHGLARLMTVALLAIVPLTAAAQRTTTATAGAHYEADGIVRALAGGNWRELWTTPVQVPFLDLDTYGGGLTPEETGGRQSRTLHFQGGDGRRYIFRSVDKFLHREALPVALRHTPVGDVVQDQISTLLPAAGLLIGPLYEAVGLLHPWPTLVVMPDDPRLGEFREVYAGMLGQMEENPQEGPDDTPGFAGSSKLVGADKFVERLDETSEHRVHAAEYLAARLIQFMMGDTDRGSDQWRFARFPNENGDGSGWRPVARDHDFAFMKPEGVIGRASVMLYPKLAHFDDTFESLATLTFMTREMDRRLLVELPRARWDSIVAAVQRQLTDDVLRASAGRMPEEYQPHAADYIVSGLQARRDQLHEVAAEFFMMVSREANVHATAEPERAEVERLADGSVEVRLYAADAALVSIRGAASAAGAAAPDGTVESGASATAAAAYFQRRFMPDETREIRLYMLGGDDAVRVSGRSPNSIRVRVIGGGGDDVLVDSSQVARGGWFTSFYTAHGDDRVFRGSSTRVDSRSFAERLPGRPLDVTGLAPDPDAPEEADDEEETEDTKQPGIDEDVAERLVGAAYRDWGGTSGFSPEADFRSGSGLLLGVGADYTRYGFRREQYKYYANAKALYSLDTGGFGIELSGDYHPENTQLGVSIDASATQFETFRFFGYGNDTEPVDGLSPRVYRDQITVQPALYWADDVTYFGLGPIFRYGDPRFDQGSPIDLLGPLGADAFAQAGGAAELRLVRGGTDALNPRGIAFEAAGSVYPALLDVSEPFGRAHAVARAWVPLGWPFLALRVGADRLWGTFPVHDAAFLGGRNSLRGFETDRFAGDASLYGSTELHAPLGEVVLLVRGHAGVFGLIDAGRVYVDGESPGGWHTSLGGGVWFTSLARTLSVTYAKGETGRLYLRLGMPL